MRRRGSEDEGTAIHFGSGTFSIAEAEAVG